MIKRFLNAVKSWYKGIKSTKSCATGSYSKLPWADSSTPRPGMTIPRKPTNEQPTYRPMAQSYRGAAYQEEPVIVIVDNTVNELMNPFNPISPLYVGNNDPLYIEPDPVVTDSYQGYVPTEDYIIDNNTPVDSYNSTPVETYNSSPDPTPTPTPTYEPPSYSAPEPTYSAPEPSPTYSDNSSYSSNDSYSSSDSGGYSDSGSSIGGDY